MLTKADARRRVQHSEGTLDVIAQVEKEIERAADEGKYECTVIVSTKYSERVQQITKEAGFNIGIGVIDNKQKTQEIHIYWEI